MSKLWQEKNNKDDLSEFVNRFTVGDDYRLDRQLIPYDIKASKAHAFGLYKADILSRQELDDLHNALDRALEKWKDGNFCIRQDQEDVHTALEHFLTEILGDTGKKIHAGRSRNDQVLIAMRLFEKDKLELIAQKALALVDLYIGKGEEYADIPMPGYTHMQRAMPGSVGMWLGTMAEMLLMDLEYLKVSYNLVNRSPLGTAAGFGVNIELPRDEVAGLLGFEELIVAALTAQNTRGKIELVVLQAIEAIGYTLSHFSNDLILYTSDEFNFFRLDECLYTGSSIMPQKKNLDPAEIIRAKSGEISGSVQTVKMISHKMHSGYHRDYQQTKKHVMSSLDQIVEMIEMTRIMVENLQPKRENLIAACTPEIYAADYVHELVKKGMSFRDAYRKVKKEKNWKENIDPVKNIKSKNHVGTPGNPGLQRLEKKRKSFRLK